MYTLYVTYLTIYCFIKGVRVPRGTLRHQSHDSTLKTIFSEVREVQYTQLSV